MYDAYSFEKIVNSVAYSTRDGTKIQGHPRTYSHRMKALEDAIPNEFMQELLEAVRALNLPDYELLVRLCDEQVTRAELARLVFVNRSTIGRQLEQYLEEIRARIEGQSIC